MENAAFEDALREHLAALQARDVERFGATIDEDAAVVSGGGIIMLGREAIVRAHAEWFGAPEAWQFRYAVRFTRVLGGAAYAVIEVAYHENEHAQPSRFLLSLFFAETPDGWKFVYDQNTPLA